MHINMIWAKMEQQLLMLARCEKHQSEWSDGISKRVRQSSVSGAGGVVDGVHVDANNRRTQNQSKFILKLYESKSQFPYLFESLWSDIVLFIIT